MIRERYRHREQINNSKDNKGNYQDKRGENARDIGNQSDTKKGKGM